MTKPMIPWQPGHDCLRNRREHMMKSLLDFNTQLYYSPVAGVFELQRAAHERVAIVDNLITRLMAQSSTRDKSQPPI